MDVDVIARVCHEANRALQVAHGDPAIEVSPHWDDAPESQRRSCIDGVEFHLSSTVTPRESHENWLRFKEADGWTYGPVKDEDAKTHPCFVPYDQLPPEQQAKDALFAAIVGALGE